MSKPRKRPQPKVHTVQIEDGSWYALSGFDRDICCDCGLVHDTEIKYQDGKLWFKTNRNDKATAAERKEHGITVKRKK